MKTVGITLLGWLLLAALPSPTASQEAASLDDGQWHISTQLDLSVLTLEDDSLDQEAAATLGGFGVAARLDFPLRAGLEVGLSGVRRRSDDSLVHESVFLQSVSALWYFWRSPDCRLFALTGASSLTTRRMLGEQSFRFVETGGHVGLGADAGIGNWVLSIDLRLLGLVNDTPSTSSERKYVEGRSPYPSPWASVPQARGGSLETLAFGYRF